MPKKRSDALNRHTAKYNEPKESSIISKALINTNLETEDVEESTLIIDEESDDLIKPNTSVKIDIKVPNFITLQCFLRIRKSLFNNALF